MTIPWPQPIPQQGWQCPVCKTVNAPFMPTCTRCPVPLTVTTGGTSTSDPEGGSDER